jgi:zinc transporter ZupT
VFDALLSLLPLPGVVENAAAVVTGVVENTVAAVATPAVGVVEAPTAVAMVVEFGAELPVAVRESVPGFARHPGSDDNGTDSVAYTVVPLVV